MAPDVKEPLSLFKSMFVEPYIECTASYLHIEALTTIGDASASNVSLFMLKVRLFLHCVLFVVIYFNVWLQAELRLEEELKRLKYFGTSHNADEVRGC